MVSKDWWNTKKCAEELGKSTQTIRRWIRKGVNGKTLVATKTGLDWKVSPETLKQFLFQMTQGG